ncbi:MAG TPA: hypothetical protein VJZ71_06545 [Phycisphaerae bacterium]|nr:hypothetical protein [Phycisphaerae bacterium]
MSEKASTSGVAIRLPAQESEHQAIAVFVGPVAWETATRFLPKDDDELNAWLCAGRFVRVVFADLNSLLEMIWKEQADLEKWRSAGVEIELAAPPEGGMQWRPLAANIYKSYSEWRSLQRKRQIVAAIVLSAAALLAMAALFFCIPPAK